jgi:hypothetical protein
LKKVSLKKAGIKDIDHLVNLSIEIVKDLDSPK